MDSVTEDDASSLSTEGEELVFLKTDPMRRCDVEGEEPDGEVEGATLVGVVLPSLLLVLAVESFLDLAPLEVVDVEDEELGT